MPSLSFNLDGIAHEIELYPDLAPVTIGKVIASLPAALDIHCAKIAGQHIFWHAPVVADIEKPADILTLPAGTFLYWPERQFLELIYGDLQAEKAQVSVLGRLTGDLGWLKDFGRRVVENHGQEPLLAQLAANEDALALALPEKSFTSPGLNALRAARKAMWQAPPEEMYALLRREGMMIPYGPLAMAEGELRKLHELIWRLRSPSYGIGTAERASVLSFLINAFNARIDGFCAMHATGKVLDDAKALLSAPDDIDDVIEELVLFTGRAAAWLDTFIPWNALNEATRTALARQDLR
ncbi:hypothetical protein [Ancylobacter rudongensis]|uniref:Uncharacterized protein n=1 Tax=Ancylobacter rudongensis TaxID=177413 RepID=A0A1G4SD22_9HYPH|nr:hypothetical protein [Ancylobacter rudongensis]SCW66921.1 hypothetical protein SAMN05660859_2112 [Ancylobacter rudongensis]